MASVFKQRWSKRDPTTGEIRRGRTAAYYAEFIDADGVTVRRSTGLTDKRMALAVATDWEQAARRVREGLDAPSDRHAGKSLAELLAEYAGFLRSKGDAERHVVQETGRIERAFAGAGFDSPRELDGPKLAAWLAGRRKAGFVEIEIPNAGGRPGEKRRTVRRSFGQQTSNQVLGACRAFSRWATKHRRLPADPFEAVERVARTEPKRIRRRALSPADFAKLIRATAAGPEVRGLSGGSRAMLYQVAAYTGLRARELASLTAASVTIDTDVDGRSWIDLPASASKRRREDRLPLRGDLARRLGDWLAARGVGEGSEGSLWPGRWHEAAAKMIRVDLTAAGIEAETPAGRFDFHALRGLLSTWLAKAGARPKATQELMRHSTIDLTMNTYTHLEVSDTTAALDLLPALPELPGQPGQLGAATGEPGAGAGRGRKGRAG